MYYLAIFWRCAACVWGKSGGVRESRRGLATVSDEYSYPLNTITVVGWDLCTSNCLIFMISEEKGHHCLKTQGQVAVMTERE